MKRIVATFYATDSGREPVRDWILGLGDDRKIVGQDISTAEFGWPVGMPTCRSIRDGIWEVRSTIRKGKVEARTYFSIEGNLMLLLHGHDGKKGQQEAIKLAIDRLKDHHSRQMEAKRKRRRND